MCCETFVSNATRNGREIDVEKASRFAPGNSVRKSRSDLRRNGFADKTEATRRGNEETDGEYNKTTERDKKIIQTTEREKEKKRKE